jgi:hypothetical protein
MGQKKKIGRVLDRVGIAAFNVLFGVFTPVRAPVPPLEECLEYLFVGNVQHRLRFSLNLHEIPESSSLELTLLSLLA